MRLLATPEAFSFCVKRIPVDGEDAPEGIVNLAAFDEDAGHLFPGENGD